MSLEINELEYQEYMYLLESQVKDAKRRWYDLQEMARDILDPVLGKRLQARKDSGVTPDAPNVHEIYVLQDAIRERQYDYFVQWYKLNKRLEDIDPDHRHIGAFMPGYVFTVGQYLINKDFKYLLQERGLMGD